MTALRSSSTNNSDTGTAVSVTAPSGTTTGDLVVVEVTANGVVTIVDNNGGTPFTAPFAEYQETSAGISRRVFRRRIVGGDPSTYNFTIGASGRWSVIARAFSSPHATDDFDVTPASGNSAQQSSGTTLSAVDITTNFANSIHCVSIGTDSPGNAVTATPAGYNVDQNNTQFATECSCCCTKTIASPGATGAQSFTYTNSDGAITFSYAIKDHTAGGDTLMSQAWM